MLSIRLSLKSRGMWRKFYQAQGEWTTSPHSTVIVDQNWNAPLFNSTFCQNCTNFEAWLLTITFARKFDRLIIKGVWKIILEIWNSSQNMATSLLWARFSCHFVNVMPVFEETTWGRCEKAETQMTPFYRINPRWMGIFQSLGEGVVPQGGFSRVNRSQLRPPRPGPWSTNGSSGSARVGSVNNVGRNYHFTAWMLSQSPQSPGILATRGRFTKKGENQVFPKSILWSRLVFQGAGSTSDVLVCNLNNLRAGHRWGGLSK